MRHAIAAASALLAGFGMLQMGNALQGTLLALRGEAEGFSSVEIGSIMSGFFLGMGAGAFFASTLIRRAGHLRSFAALASLASVGALAHLLFVDILPWLFIRAFSGFCFAGLLMIVESWLNASVESRDRGGLLAIYASVGLGAGALGQMQVSLAEPTSYILFIIVSITLSLALVPASLSRAAAPIDEIPEGRLDFALVLRASPFGAGAMLLTGMSVGCFFALGPVFAANLGLTNSELGVFMALATGAAMLAQWPLGRLSDRWSRRLIASVTAATSAAAMFLFLVLPSGGFVLMLVLAVLLGATLFPTQAIAAAQVNDRMEVRHMVTAAGTLVLVFAIGAATGPVVGGLFMDEMGPSGFLLSLLGFQVALAALGAARLVMRPSEEGEARTTISPVIPQPVASAMTVDEEAQGELFLKSGELA